MCSVKVDVVGVDPLAAVENLEGDDVVDVVGAAELGGVRRPGGPEVLGPVLGGVRAGGAVGVLPLGGVVAPEREREVFLLPRQGGKKSCELGVLRAPLALVGGAGGGAVGEAGVAHARVAKLELALELGGSVAVEDEELECSGVVGGEGGGADRSRAVHVPRGERLCGVQVEVLAVVADAVVERSLEVEDLCALLRGAESECGTFVAVPEPLVVPLLGAEQASHVAAGHGAPGL